MATSPLPRKPLLRTDRDTGALCKVEYQLTVQSGPNAGKKVRLDRTLVVGSDSKAGLRLTDPTVSRRHLELQPRADGVFVRDLGSTNGTEIAGMRVVEGLVAAEATIQVGSTSLQISMREENLGRPEGNGSFGGVVGESAPMRRLFGILERVAATDSTVLIQGETGTGKEVIAESLHRGSLRCEKPFVVFDCGAVSASLIESELFGHVKGSFTGAIADRLGAFAEADGGTLFLDEIGELPPELQPKLLRVLENGVVKRLGDDTSRRVNVRVIAATHRDLEAAVKEKRFRQDLFFRLAVIQVHIPPLRERPGDIAPLARHFVDRMGRTDFVLSAHLLARLSAYSWPGNVRELRNVIERALSGELVELVPAESSPPPGALTEAPFKVAKDRLVEEFTREYFEALSRACGGNLRKMARAAGVHRNHVQRLVAKYGLKTKGDR